MAITKLGNYLEKKALFEMRTDMLTPEEKEALVEHYDLPRDAMLNARSAIRGALGSNLGGMLGGIAGVGAGLAFKRPLAPAIGMGVGGLGGALLGEYLATNKYTSDNARRILAMKKLQES